MMIVSELSGGVGFTHALLVTSYDDLAGIVEADDVIGLSSSFFGVQDVGRGRPSFCFCLLDRGVRFREAPPTSRRPLVGKVGESCL